jgi:CopG family nickel-responsive transcriptional regulator
MSEIVRFTVSVEEELQAQFDQFCQRQHFATRSEAVRQLIREKLTAEAWQSSESQVAGTLTLVYDHHRSQLSDQLMQLQHDNTDLIVSTTHIHLDSHLCLEVIILRGSAGRLQEVASRLQGLKGIRKGELVMASAQTH